MESVIVPVGINFTFLKYQNAKSLVEQGRENFPPALEAIEWAMQMTNVNRLFTPQDFKELLVRINLLFKQNKPIANWFKEEYLFSYRIGDQLHTLSHKELFDYVGLETSSALENYSDRSTFIKNIDTAFINGFWSSILGDNKVTVFEAQTKEQEGEKVVTFHTKEHVPEITKETIQHSAFLADEIMKEVPKDLFEGTAKLFDARITDIQHRKELHRLAPKFRFEELPQDLVDECVKIMYEGSDYVDDFLARKEGIEEGIDFMIETAWGYANDLFVPDHWGCLSPSEFMKDYDYDRMNDLGDLAGLEGFMSFWNIEDTKPLLKGWFVSDEFQQALKKYRA
jgi:hypothetical protein